MPTRMAMPVALALAALISAVGGCRRQRPRLERGDAAVVVRKPAVTTPMPEGIPAVREQEPATPGSGPMPLALAPGASLAVEGTLAPAGPGDIEDQFTVQLGDPAAAPRPDGGAPSHQLAVEVTAAALATTVTVRDAQGRVLASSAAPAGLPHGVPNLATGATGVFSVSLRRTGKSPPKGAPPPAPEAGGYVLVVRSFPLGPGDEHEPNEEPATATAIGPTHSEPQVAGYLGTRGDQDVYRIPLGEVAEGTVLHLDLEPPGEAVASLAVLDGQGQRVAGVKGRKGERLGLRNLDPLRLVGGVGAPGPGAFFHAVVRSEGPGVLGHRYVLGVRGELAPDREREPNDDPARASSLRAESSGHLGPGDVDVWRVEAAAGGVLELHPPPRADLVLELAAGGGWSRVDQAGRGQPERTPVTSPLLVRVLGKRPTDGQVDAPYRLVLTPGGASGAPAP